MKNDTVVVQYPRVFPAILSIAGLFSIGFAICTMIIPIKNTKGSIISLGISELMVFIVLFLIAEFAAWIIYRWKIVASNDIVYTPYIGPTRAFTYSDIVRVKQRLTYKSYYTEKHKAFSIEQNAMNQYEFERKWRDTRRKI